MLRCDCAFAKRGKPLILEAIRYNKPFIASQEMGLYESLKDIGVFINPLDTEDIVQKILMLADYGMYQTYKQKVEAYTVVHDWNAIAKEFIATIESL
jgi:glycosyltransferase involved in cell wall biosynthesis